MPIFAQTLSVTMQVAQTKGRAYSQRSIRHFFINNWCLKRSKVIYALTHRWVRGEVRINIAVECRERTDMDWGHAWVTLDGKPFLEPNKKLLERAMTKIAETGKYVYWIYNSKSNG